MSSVNASQVNVAYSNTLYTLSYLLIMPHVQMYIYNEIQRKEAIVRDF